MRNVAGRILRRIAHPRIRPRLANQHSTRVLRTNLEVQAAALVLGRQCRGSSRLVRTQLETLFQQNTTSLYVQIEHTRPHLEVVLSRSKGTKVVVSSRRLHLEAETPEPAPDGAYLTERQYRQLGLYEMPPTERAVIAVAINSGTDSLFLVDAPAYVEGATVVVNGQLLAAAVPLPAGSELRYRSG